MQFHVPKMRSLARLPISSCHNYDSITSQPGTKSKSNNYCKNKDSFSMLDLIPLVSHDN